MKYKAQVTIMPHKEILDPQGKAVKSSLQNLGIRNIEDVRIGKNIVLEMHAPDQKTAELSVEEACKKLLANPIMESYSYTITLSD